MLPQSSPRTLYHSGEQQPRVVYIPEYRVGSSLEGRHFPDAPTRPNVHRCYLGRPPLKSDRTDDPTLRTRPKTHPRIMLIPTPMPPVIQRCPEEPWPKK
jgi:hypothetical protein